MDLTFNCDDGVSLDWTDSEPENQCGARLDISQGADLYGTLRADGSYGQVENVQVLSPAVDTIYSGTVY